jgi:hypothetical protein
VSAVLLVRLKIPDLTALTALDAGRKLLPQGYELTRLVREELILFEPSPGVSAGEFEPALAHAVETSNFFVNPNKERYRLLRAAERGPALVPAEGGWGILARSRSGTEDLGLLDRLMREHPLRGLRSIRRARIWWLWTRGPEGDTGADRCYPALGPVKSTASGLLVNPHSEGWLRLDSPVSWSRIEAFLAEAASAALEPA